MLKVYGLIYLMTNLINGKKYVGQTTYSLRVRFHRHFNGAKHPGKKNFYFHKALRKYGPEGFSISLLCSCSTKEELDLMEDLYILVYDTINPDKGYNSKRGGASGKFSEESKKRCSLSKKGIIKWTEASRLAASQRLRGKNNPMFGKKATEESRKRMSHSRSGRNSYKYRTDISTEEILHLYREGKSTTQIGKIFGIDGSTVGDRLSKAGVPRRRKGWPRREDTLCPYPT